MKQEDVIEIGAFEAKNRLSALVDMAAAGRQIWITKRGRRMALLSSGLGEPAGADAGLLDDFRALRKRSRSGKESLKNLIEEGRR